jgi:hypothetical protein
MVSSQELGGFLTDLTLATGHAGELDRHFRLQTARQLHEGADEGLLSLSSRRSGMALFAADSLHDGIEKVRRTLLAVLLKSHGAVQQAALLARCLPQTAAGSRACMASTSASVLEAIWRTAAGLCRALGEVARAGNSGTVYDEALIKAAEANATFLLRAKALPAVSLLQEDFCVTLSKRVRRWARATPRAAEHSKAVQGALITLHRLRSQFERQEGRRRGQPYDDFLLLCDDGTAVMQHAVPLGDVFALLCLSEAQRESLEASLAHVQLQSRARLVGMELLSYALDELVDGAAQSDLFRAVTEHRLGAVADSKTAGGCAPTPVEVSKWDVVDKPCRQAMQKAYAGIYRRLVELLRERVENSLGSNDCDSIVDILAVMATTLMGDSCSGNNPSRAPADAQEGMGVYRPRPFDLGLASVTGRLVSLLTSLLHSGADALGEGGITVSGTVAQWRRGGKEYKGEGLDDGSYQGSAAVLHEACWAIIRLLIQQLCSPPTGTPAETQQQSARAAVLQAGAAPPVTLSRRHSAPQLAGQAVTGADDAVRATALASLLDFLSGELQRVLPALDALLKDETSLLQAHLMAQAQPLVQSPRHSPPGLPQGLMTKQLQSADDCHKSFSACFWLYVPEPLSDSAQDTPGERLTVLLARPTEVASSLTQLSSRGSSEQQLLEVCHPSVCLLETQHGGQRRLALRFSTLATTLEGSLVPDSARAPRSAPSSQPGGQRRSRTGSMMREQAPGASAAGAAPSLPPTRDAEARPPVPSTANGRPPRPERAEDLRQEIVAGAGAVPWQPGGAASGPRTPAKRCSKETLSTPSDYEVPTGRWTHVSCVYRWDDVAHKSFMRVQVNGATVATSTTAAALPPPLCSDLVLLRSSKQASASGIQLVDACFVQRDLRAEEVQGLVSTGPYSGLLERRRRVGLLAARLLAALREVVKDPKCLKKCATSDWVLLLLRLLKAGNAPVRRAASEICQRVLPAVSPV